MSGVVGPQGPIGMTGSAGQGLFGTQSERERLVRSLHAYINPQQAKGMRLTDFERRLLLDRLEELKVEIENAAQYMGAL